jgi:hypothetical protein
MISKVRHGNTSEGKGKVWIAVNCLLEENPRLGSVSLLEIKEMPETSLAPIPCG